MTLIKETDDFRFHWFKKIIYKTLSIDFSDPAFEELIEKNKFARESLANFISGSNEEKTCLFFYCTVEEEEVEVDGKITNYQQSFL